MTGKFYDLYEDVSSAKSSTIGLEAVRLRPQMLQSYPERD